MDPELTPPNLKLIRLASPSGSPGEGPRPANLHPAFKEARQSGLALELDQDRVPWLEKRRQVQLTEVTLADSGKKFLIGSLISGKKLEKAAIQMTDPQRQSADRLLYSHLPDIIDNGTCPGLEQIVHRITQDPIFTLKNSPGQRVCFFRLKVQGQDVIIRLAAYDKARQLDVLSVLTNQSRKQIKYSGRL